MGPWSSASQHRSTRRRDAVPVRLAADICGRRPRHATAQSSPGRGSTGARRLSRSRCNFAPSVGRRFPSRSGHRRLLGTRAQFCAEDWPRCGRHFFVHGCGPWWNARAAVAIGMAIGPRVADTRHCRRRPGFRGGRDRRSAGCGRASACATCGGRAVRRLRYSHLFAMPCRCE